MERQSAYPTQEKQLQAQRFAVNAALQQALPWLRAPDNAWLPHLPISTEALMTLLRRPAVRLYALGQASILIGAGLMDYLGSMIPMALGASAGLMLCLPLAREMGGRWFGQSGRSDRTGP